MPPVKPIARLQELWANGAFELIVSEAILEEIKETLQKPYIRNQLYLQEGELDEIISLIRERAFLLTTDAYLVDRIIDDPDDNTFLACALEADADYIVSGDNHLLSLKHYQRIQIVDAVTFIRKIAEKD